MDPYRLMVITTIDATIGTFFHRQLNCLADDGFQVHAVSSPGPILDKLARRERAAGAGSITCHAIPMERQPHPRRDLVSLWRLFRLMRQIRPHAVHVHTPKAGLLGMLAAWMAGVKVRMYTIHGLPLETRHGWWRKALKSFERTTCRFATRVYSVSPSLEQVVRGMDLCSGDKLSTLGDGSCGGIDIEQFSPDSGAARATVRQAEGIPLNAQVICFVGRIARDKGIQILATAWQELSLELPNVYLLFCGPDDPSDPVAPDMLALLKGHPRVRMTGQWASNVRDIYAASDICVLPTYREGLPQVVLEAGAMGLPVVASRVTGVVSALQENVTGLLVPAGDPNALAKGLRLLVINEEMRRRLGFAARQFITSRFSSTRVNQLWMNEYRRCASRVPLAPVVAEEAGTRR
jgi:glycosyltransferase involved in cell wall biosynthesis